MFINNYNTRSFSHYPCSFFTQGSLLSFQRTSRTTPATTTTPATITIGIQIGKEPSSSSPSSPPTAAADESAEVSLEEESEASEESSPDTSDAGSVVAFGSSDSGFVVVVSPPPVGASVAPVVESPGPGSSYTGGAVVGTVGGVSSASDTSTCPDQSPNEAFVIIGCGFSFPIGC